MNDDFFFFFFFFFFFWGVGCSVGHCLFFAIVYDVLVLGV